MSYKVEIMLRGEWRLLAERVTKEQALSLVNKGGQAGIITRKVLL